MLTAVGIVVFVVGIMLSIALHELGHLLPAKRFGVKITQYMIGFGPTVWSRRKGETEIGVKAIPLGGYVRMIGMYPPAAPGRGGSGRLSKLMAEARAASAAEVETAEDEPRTFYRLSAPRKIVVMLGGPTTNLVVAFILFAIVLVGFGIPQASLKVDSISKCVPSTADVYGDCASGNTTPSPANAAGVKAGDLVVSLAGKHVSDWTTFSNAIHVQGAGETTLVVTRGGSNISLPITLVAIPRQVVQGGHTVTRTVGFIGISPAIAATRQSITTVPGYVWDLSVRSLKVVVSIPVRMVDVAKSVFGNAPRDPNGPISIVGAGRISGQIAGTQGMPTSWKIADLLGLIASLNLFLFLFNLIPLLPLDGGHVVGAAFEGVRRQFARMRQRPDPGPVDVARMLPVAYTVSILLVSMSVLLIYADLVKPISIG
ncbi:MAG: site-2 protease family protein [Actinomycetes bacterium]